ncbi:MAG TPA: DUF5916 domain-containing protein [Polyangia bacterium]|jgi:hypothetical protein
MRRVRAILLLLLLLLLPAAAGADAAAASAPAAAGTLRAVRVTTPPVVDGRLDDPAWSAAPVHRGFVQRQPAEGAAATEDTEVRFVYDDRALYVGIRCHDRQAPLIQPRLGRRDSLPQSDWVSVALDPYFDHKSAFVFQINSAGIQADAAIADGSEDDYAWDAVWDGAVHVGRAEWTAELRIPFATLRFPQRNDQRWGVHVRRYLNRSQELSESRLIGSGTTAYVGNFEVLTGLGAVRPGLSLALLPYGLLQGNPSYAADNLAPRDRLRLNGGLDLKYAITGQLTLDATLNPDFGQVEVDPDVINLSAIETFYPEKRPFFTEGAEIFRTPLLLLHTRRIGAPPPAPDPINAAGSLSAVDELPRIYGAAKVTGRVGPGTSLGVLSALVGATGATETDPAPGGTTAAHATASPLTHYGALRLRQQLAGPSSAGVLVTMVQRASPGTALPTSPTGDHYVGAVDLDLRGSGPYSLVAQAAGSSGTCDEQRQARRLDCVPVGGYVQAGRTGGEHLRAWVQGRFLAPDFSFNDAGYQAVRDTYEVFAQAGWRTPRPWWRTANTENVAYVYQFWNQEGYSTARGFGHTGYWKWRSFFETTYDTGLDFPRFDPLETRYGRFPYHRTWSPWFWFAQTTNASRPVSGRLEGAIIEEAGQYDVRLIPSLTVLAGRRLQLQIGAGWRGYFNRWRWIETVTLDQVDHYVFNRITYHQLDCNVRMTATLLKGLTAQLYMQLLHASGRYPTNDYRELLDPTTLGPLTFTYGADADFTHTSFISNLVLRWEYRPLSTVYLVWTHSSRFDAGTVPGSVQTPGTFGLGGALRDLWNVQANDVVMLKAAYLFQL